MNQSPDAVQPLSSAGHDQRPATDDEAAQSMSLLGGVANHDHLPQADDFGDVDAPHGGGGLSRGTLAVILVALVALGALYAMRVMQGEVGATSDGQVEARMEQILAKLDNPDALDESDPLHPSNMQTLFQDTDAIVASLEIDLAGRQVPAEYVKKNPFTLPIEEEAPEPEVDPDAAERQRQAELRRLEGEVERLNLQSVMGSGSNPVAVIDGEIHRPGDAIRGFEITRIDATAQTVTLEQNGHAFTLSMGD